LPAATPEYIRLMRSLCKWLIFGSYWAGFAAAVAGALWMSVTGGGGTAFWPVVGYAIASLAALLLSLSWSWVFTSPRLGRRILHDSGTYYMDISVLRYSHHSVKARLTVYRDRVFLKRVVHTCDLDPTIHVSLEAAIETEVRRALRTMDFESALRGQIGQVRRSALNLLSTESKRAGRIGDVFRGQS
jgi:hypothetical protein